MLESYGVNLKLVILEVLQEQEQQNIESTLSKIVSGIILKIGQPASREQRSKLKNRVWHALESKALNGKIERTISLNDRKRTRIIYKKV